MTDNNFWHHKVDSDSAIVFVHGFFSNSQECWKCPTSKVYWPNLIIAEEKLANYSVFMGGYYTSADSLEYGVRDCAQELMAGLQRDGDDGTPSPMTKDRVIFVCHSLGGIVVRYLLESSRELFKSKKVGLVLMASPSWGSDYADRYSFIASLYKNRVGSELRRGSELLRDLDGRFKDFLELMGQEFMGREAVEHFGILHSKWLPRLNLSFIPGYDPIVLKESADRYFSKGRTIPQTNHSSIVKPNSSSHQSHHFLMKFFDDFGQRFGFPKLLQGGAGQGSRSSEMLTRDVLFDVYSQESEAYYLVRGIDKNLSVNFEVASFWIYGPSGCGKTSLVKRLLAASGVRVVEMCFSHCTQDGARDQFVLEMFETLHMKRHGIGNMPSATFSNLVQVLVENILQEGSSFVIYIDEVPSGGACSEIANVLVGLIEDLLLHVKSRTNGNMFRVLVSSLFAPALAQVKNLDKFNGYFYLVPCDVWGEAEIKGLAQLILPSIPAVALADLPTDIMVGDKVSPRKLKNFIKLKLARPMWTDAQLLEQVLNREV